MEFFDGLNCRLRVSGMIADSIMMGIVNSAMEEAYEKTCSKEGDLERLNEKSRFCGLAIMQLEWCLMFLQEEVDCYIVESSREREKLVSDLTETRDRIQRRLEETELAIAEKDRELMVRMESESELRRALEVRDEELCSLRTSLELERVVGGRGRAQEFVPGGRTCEGSKEGDEAFGELRDATDQQMCYIAHKLEEGKDHATNLMRKLSMCSFHIERLETELKMRGVEGSSNFVDTNISSNEEVGSDVAVGYCEIYKSCDGDAVNICLRTDLNALLENIGVNVGILKEKVKLAFEMTDMAISSSNIALDGQMWGWAVENETIGIVLRNFLRDIQVMFDSKPLGGIENVPLVILDRNWSSLMEDITNLRDELERVATQIDTQLRTAGRDEINYQCTQSKVDSGINDSNQKNTWLGVMPLLDGKYSDAAAALETHSESSNASSKFEKQGNMEDPPKENPMGHANHFVAEMVRNHESIIRKKTRETNWLKGEISKEKGHPPFRNDQDLDYIKTWITELISRLECILEENTKLVGAFDDRQRAYHKDKHFLWNNLAGRGLAEKVKKVIHTSTVVPRNFGNELACYSMGADFCEEIRQLKKDREDSYLNDMVMEETNAILFKVFVKKLHLESIDYNIETLIREDVYSVIFSEIIKEWNHERGTYDIERVIREEIDQIVFSQVFQDIKCSDNLNFTKGQEEYLSCLNTLFQSPGINEREDIVPEQDSLSNSFEVEEYLISNSKSDLMRPQVFMDLGWDLEGYDEQNIKHAPTLVEDDTFSLVSYKLEKALQQIIMSKMQLRELGSSLGLPLDGTTDIALDMITSVNSVIHDGEHSLCIPIKNGEKNLNDMQSVLKYFTDFSQLISDFSQLISDFELVACKQIGSNMSRLEGMNCQLNLLFQQMSSLRKKELLYRKAFIRRCHDLQTAEAEVDLLGDEVDALLGFLEKIYIALDHYSPVLQHYSGIMDILRLIRKELRGGGASCKLVI